MEVVVAKSAGFCFGVKRAVETVYEEVGKGKKIYTYGPIIHNEEVVKDLEEKGVVVLENEEQLKNLKEGTVIIRSHGVEQRIQKMIEDQGLECIDATCPFVKRIHKIVKEAGENNMEVVIAGNAGHPEVEGIVGWTNATATILETIEEAKAFEKKTDTPVCMVSQTTFNYKKFQDIVEIFEKKGYNGSVVNTICNATEERQTEARKIAASVDVMIVIGGKHSSNTRKLYEICKQECENTYFIQTLDDLHLEIPKSVQLVGITAGASTPKKIIEEVQNYVSNYE